MREFSRITFGCLSRKNPGSFDEVLCGLLIFELFALWPQSYPGFRTLIKAKYSDHLLGSFLSTSPRRYWEHISFSSPLDEEQHLRIIGGI
jgi:hypothetical protein